ncbi:MAG TPA: hypothetical protein VF331_20470 [Polyangiales bacterium]
MTVGADHVVKLPSELPEGPAEVIVIPNAGRAVPGSASAARRAAMGRYHGQRFFIADNFDAPLPSDIAEQFESEPGR